MANATTTTVPAPIEIGMLVFPDITQLDLTGPFELLARVPGARVHLLWKDTRPVSAGSGLVLQPTKTFGDAPPLDMVFVPGGFGHRALTKDQEVLAFLRAQGARARYVTSVCTGALVLGAAGLLDGYEATTHWAYVERLAGYGARYVKRRVVVDRNRITGGGVTAGIDFGLRMVAELAGERAARLIQLGLEYDPEPPFDSGHPDRADAELTAEIRRRFAAREARDDVSGDRAG